MPVEDPEDGVCASAGPIAVAAPAQASDPLVGIAVARIRHRKLLQKCPSGSARVVRVHADEGDPLSEPCRQALEERELLATGPAPGRPLVDHHGAPPKLGEAALERR